MAKHALLSKPKTHMKRAMAFATVLLTLIASLQISAASATEPVPSLVLDRQAVSPGSVPKYLTAVGSSLFFILDVTPGVDGVDELWKTDGTAAGTLKVKDVRIDQSVDGPLMTAVGNTLFYIAIDVIGNFELWKSNGTEAGTVLVRGLPVLDGTTPKKLTAVGDVLFFVNADNVSGSELWKSGGTSETTSRITDIDSGSADSNPDNLTTIGDVLYFSAYTVDSGRELYRSNATTGVTELVRNMKAAGSGEVDQIRALGSNLYFAAESDEVSNKTLWVTQGTSETTTRVSSNDPYLTLATSNKIFYVNNSSNNELWMSGGTPASTLMVKDIEQDIGPLVAVGSSVYFTDDDSQEQLWVSDGTSLGTVLLGNGFTEITQLTAVGDTLFFTTNSEAKLWMSDGTAEGTKEVVLTGSGTVSYLTAIGNSLYFQFGSSGAASLWGFNLPLVTTSNSSGTGSSYSEPPTPTPTPTPTAPVVNEPSTTKAVRFSRFIGDSGKLPALASQGIARTLSSYSTIDRVVCTGFTSGTKATRIGRKVALQRAQNACNVAKRLAPKALIQVRVNVASGVGPKFRSVQLNITGN